MKMIMFKNRITLLCKMAPVRSELCSAVLSARIQKIQKETYWFNSFAVVLIGEIQG